MFTISSKEVRCQDQGELSDLVTQKPEAVCDIAHSEGATKGQRITKSLT